MQQNDVDRTLKNLLQNLSKQRQPTNTIDGYARHAEDEQRLNELAYATFASPSGQQFLNYLRQITLNSPLGPDADDFALRHREGMRYLFGLIHKRYEKGKDDANRGRY
jgi:hypothetical protein